MIGLKLIKQYKRKNKLFFLFEVQNNSDQSWAGPKLHLRPQSAVSMADPNTKYKITWQQGMTAVDELGIGSKVKVKCSIDLNSCPDLPDTGELVLRFGLVKELVAWLAFVDVEVVL